MLKMGIKNGPIRIKRTRTMVAGDRNASQGIQPSFGHKNSRLG